MHEQGLSPYEATKIAMQELGGALIAMSLVLCAVFIPVSFLSGITGMLYRQFTITISRICNYLHGSGAYPQPGDVFDIPQACYGEKGRGEEQGSSGL